MVKMADAQQQEDETSSHISRFSFTVHRFAENRHNGKCLSCEINITDNAFIELLDNSILQLTSLTQNHSPHETSAEISSESRQIENVTR